MKKKLKPINQNNSKIINNNNTGNNIIKIIKKEKDNVSFKDEKENVKINNIIDKNQDAKENSKEKKNENKEIGTKLIDRNNYENFFRIKNLNDDLSEEQALEERKNEFNII